MQKLCKKEAKFTEHDEDDGDIEFVVIEIEKWVRKVLSGIRVGCSPSRDYVIAVTANK